MTLVITLMEIQGKVIYSRLPLGLGMRYLRHRTQLGTRHGLRTNLPVYLRHYAQKVPIIPT